MSQGATRCNIGVDVCQYFSFPEGWVCLIVVVLHVFHSIKCRSFKGIIQMDNRYWKRPEGLIVSYSLSFQGAVI